MPTGLPGKTSSAEIVYAHRIMHLLSVGVGALRMHHVPRQPKLAGSATALSGLTYPSTSRRAQPSSEPSSEPTSSTAVSCWPGSGHRSGSSRPALSAAGAAGKGSFRAGGERGDSAGTISCCSLMRDRAGQGSKCYQHGPWRQIVHIAWLDIHACRVLSRGLLISRCKMLSTT